MERQLLPDLMSALRNCKKEKRGSEDPPLRAGRKPDRYNRQYDGLRDR
jgi:hypothetical protein